MTRKSQPLRLNPHTQTNKGYRYIDKDPALYEVARMIADSGLSFSEIERMSGVTRWTLRKWLYGNTRRPQNITIDFVARACGFEREWKATNSKVRRK